MSTHTALFSTNETGHTGPRLTRARRRLLKLRRSRLTDKAVKLKMQSYCHFCAAKLRGLRLRCPGCRRSTIGWLHVALVAALDAAGLFCLLRP